jgi:hypothetical protein
VRLIRRYPVALRGRGAREKEGFMSNRQRIVGFDDECVATGVILDGADPACGSSGLLLEMVCGQGNDHDGTASLSTLDEHFVRALPRPEGEDEDEDWDDDDEDEDDEDDEDLEDEDQEDWEYDWEEGDEEDEGGDDEEEL